LTLPQTFIGGKKERFVFDDGTAHLSAELVALERRRPARGKSKKVSRVEDVIPQKLKDLAMIFVGARSGGYVDDRARALPVLGTEG
jgi:hypothetical protein